MRKTATIFFILIVILCVATAWSQTYEGTIQQSINGTTLNVDLLIQTKTGTSEYLGDATFSFSYNSAALTYSGKDAAFDGIWDSGTNTDYNDLGASDFAPNASLDVTKSGSGSTGLQIPSGSPTRIGRIQFTITDAGANSGIQWNAKGVLTTIRDYAGGSGIEDRFTLTDPSDYSLPVQMSDISASASQFDGILITWSTHSETNTAGFHVWRSKEETGEYQQVTTSLIPGQGNSSTAQTYSFNDRNVEDGILYWYKIQELAMDGGSAYYGPVSVVGINPIPRTYDLSQNYPNPFNPETRFHYQLPEETEVSIIIYSLLGQKIRNLVNEKQPAGYYQKIWDSRDTFGHNVPSGIYFLQINAGSFKAIRKMALMR